jgi:hypothetical protein
VTHSAAGAALLTALALQPSLRRKIAALAILATPAPHLAGFRRAAAQLGLAFCQRLGRFPARKLGFAPEDEDGGIMGQWLRWNLRGQWVTQEDLDVLESLPELDFPVLLVAGQGDWLWCPSLWGAGRAPPTRPRPSAPASVLGGSRAHPAAYTRALMPPNPTAPRGKASLRSPPRGHWRSQIPARSLPAPRTLPPTRALMPPKPPRSARQSLAPLAPSRALAEPDPRSISARPQNPTPAPLPQARGRAVAGFPRSGGVGGFLGGGKLSAHPALPVRAWGFGGLSLRSGGWAAGGPPQNRICSLPEPRAFGS